MARSFRDEKSERRQAASVPYEICRLFVDATGVCPKTAPMSIPLQWGPAIVTPESSQAFYFALKAVESSAAKSLASRPGCT